MRCDQCAEGRRRDDAAGVIVAATLFALPHALPTRTQNCDGCVIAPLTNDGALPPTGAVPLVDAASVSVADLPSMFPLLPVYH